MSRMEIPDDWLENGIRKETLSKQTIHADKWDQEDLVRTMKEISAFAGARDALADFTPTGGPAMGDAFLALHKADPHLLDEGQVLPSHLINRVVMDEMSDLSETKRLRRFSVGDEVQAALSCASIEPDLETLFDRLRQEQKQAEELEKTLIQLAGAASSLAEAEADLDAMFAAMSGACDDEGDGEGEGEGEGSGDSEPSDEQKEALEAAAQRAAELREQYEELKAQAQGQASELADAMDEEAPTIARALRAALGEASADAQRAMDTALAWGLDPGELQRMDPEVRLEMARKLKSDRFRRIADLFGPMRNLMLSEQARRTSHAKEEIYDVETGSDISQLLPSELASLKHRLLRFNFLRKFAQRGLLQYALQGTERLARGGIIFCADEQTEILTDEGWKRYDEVRVGEHVLTLNHDTGVAEWQPTSRINVFDAAPRQMLSMEGQRHSSLTTMDHRWPVMSAARRDGGIRLREPRWKTSENLTTEDRIRVAAPCANLPTIAKYSDAVVELVAWTWTEGTILPGGSSLRIYQSEKVNPQHCASIRAALTAEFGPACKLDMRTIREQQIAAWREETNPTTGITSFHLNVWASRPILDHLDEQKVVDPLFISRLTQSQLELFVNKSIDGDGQRRNGVDILGQRVEERNRSFEMACILLGRPVNTVAYDEKRPERKPGTKQFFTSARGNDTITIHNKGTFKREIVEHNGIVWCPTTPNGTWLARRRGTVYFTGNCEDGSGSMSGERELWSKATMLCLLDLARRQKRTMHVVHFGGPGAYELISFENPGDFSFDRIVEAAEIFYGGGTDFETPMRVALEILQREFSTTGGVKADVVFMTDGECWVREEFMGEYLDEMHRMQATTWGIDATGGRAARGGPLEQMAEGKVASVRDFLSGEDIRTVFGGV